MRNSSWEFCRNAYLAVVVPLNTDAGSAKKKTLPLWLPVACESVLWLIYLPVIFWLE